MVEKFFANVATLNYGQRIPLIYKDFTRLSLVTDWMDVMASERGKWQRKDRIAQGGYRKEGDRATAPKKKVTPPPAPKKDKR